MTAERFEQEFRVNTLVENDQGMPAVAIAPDGTFVVVWRSDEQDGGGGGIFAQIYDQTGTALRTFDIPVNTTTAGNQFDPEVAIAPDGTVVVTWVSEAQDDDDDGVFARRFSATGAPLSSEFQVNTFTDDDQTDPVIAVAADGSFTIAWTSEGQDGSGDGIFAQQFNADGQPEGDEFQVNTTTSADQSNPAIAMTPDGDFIIAWESENQDDTFSTGIFAQRYEADGDEVGDELQINSLVDGDQVNPAIAIDSDGNFVAVWESTGTGTGSSEIIGRRFDSDGDPLDQDFLVNVTTDGDQTNPDIAIDGDGNVFVIWMSEGNGTEGEDIFARQFDNQGQALTSEFRVNTFVDDDQRNGAIAQNDLGDTVIVWEGLGQDSGTTGGGGVFGQQFKEPANLPGETISGNGQDNRLIGTDRADQINGRRGNDILLGRNGNDILNGGGGDDRLRGNRDEDTLNGQGGSDILRGGANDDTLNGAGGDDTLRGGGGDDLLEGGSGTDSLQGNGGDDVLRGNRGSDTLVGGRGSDRFVLEDVKGVDIIQDFQDGEDLLVLSEGLTFAGLTFTRDDDDTLISSENNDLARLVNISPRQLTLRDFE